MSTKSSKYIFYIHIHGEQNLVNEFLTTLKAKKENENYFMEYNTNKGLFKFIFDNKINNPSTILYLTKNGKDIKSEIKNIEESKSYLNYKNIVICDNQKDILDNFNLRLYSEKIGKNKYHIITSFNTGFNKDIVFYYIINNYLESIYDFSGFEFIDIKIIDNQYIDLCERYPNIIQNYKNNKSLNKKTIDKNNELNNKTVDKDKNINKILDKDKALCDIVKEYDKLYKDEEYNIKKIEILFKNLENEYLNEIYENEDIYLEEYKNEKFVSKILEHKYVDLIN